MPEKSARAAEKRQFGRDRPREADRRRALGQVEQQRRRREPLATGAQDVGRADIARSDLTDIARAAQPRQQQTKGNSNPIHNQATIRQAPSSIATFALPPDLVFDTVSDRVRASANV